VKFEVLYFAVKKGQAAGNRNLDHLHFDSLPGLYEAAQTEPLSIASPSNGVAGLILYCIARLRAFFMAAQIAGRRGGVPNTVSFLSIKTIAIYNE